MLSSPRPAPTNPLGESSATNTPPSTPSLYHHNSSPRPASLSDQHQYRSVPLSRKGFSSHQGSANHPLSDQYSAPNQSPNLPPQKGLVKKASKPIIGWFVRKIAGRRISTGQHDRPIIYGRDSGAGASRKQPAPLVSSTFPRMPSSSSSRSSPLYRNTSPTGGPSDYGKMFQNHSMARFMDENEYKFGNKSNEEESISSSLRPFPPTVFSALSADDHDAVSIAPSHSYNQLSRSPPRSLRTISTSESPSRNASMENHLPRSATASPTPSFPQMSLSTAHSLPYAESLMSRSASTKPTTVHSIESNATAPPAQPFVGASIAQAPPPRPAIATASTSTPVPRASSSNSWNPLAPSSPNSLRLARWSSTLTRDSTHSQQSPILSPTSSQHHSSQVLSTSITFSLPSSHTPSASASPTTSIPLSILPISTNAGRSGVQAPTHTNPHPSRNPDPSSTPNENASILTLASSNFARNPSFRTTNSNAGTVPPRSAGGDRGSDTFFLTSAGGGGGSITAGRRRSFDTDASVRAVRRKGSWESNDSGWSAAARGGGGGPGSLLSGYGGERESISNNRPSSIRYGLTGGGAAFDTASINGIAPNSRPPTIHIRQDRESWISRGGGDGMSMMSTSRRSLRGINANDFEDGMSLMVAATHTEESDDDDQSHITMGDEDDDDEVDDEGDEDEVSHRRRRSLEDFETPTEERDSVRFISGSNPSASILHHPLSSVEAH